MVTLEFFDPSGTLEVAQAHAPRLVAGLLGRGLVAHRSSSLQSLSALVELCEARHQERELLGDVHAREVLLCHVRLTAREREDDVKYPALAAQPRRTNSDGTPRDLVFGNGSERGFQGWSKSKGELDARIAAGVKNWTLHDFRRALSTTLHERFGTPPHVVESILGHVSGHKAGVAGVYNKAVYLADRRKTLERWGAHLMELVEGTPRKAKVVPLKHQR